MQKLDDAVKKWRNTAEGYGLNEQLIGIADAVYVEKPECRTEDAIEDYLLEMGAQRWGTLDDEFRKHCRRAAERAVEAMSNSSCKKEKTEVHHLTAVTAVDYKKDREKWYEANIKDTALLEEVKKQDVREDRVRTGEALEALFRHANGHVWHGATEGVITEKSWTEAYNVKTIPTGEKFVCTATFGNILKTGEEGTVYERTNENVKEVAFAVLEMDAPMSGQPYTKDKLKELSEKDKQEYRGRILRDTCLIVESIGINPTTITFSGNKSYHCAFRFKNPVDVKKWNSRYNELKNAYRIIGADEAMLSLMRCTRIPLGTTKIKAEEDEGQRLVYFDANAEVDFDDFVNKTVAFASQISEEKEKETDLYLPFEKDKKTGKWHKICENRSDFIRTARVSKVENGDTQRLIVSDERGVFRYKTPQQISDYLVNYVFANAGKVEGEHFVDLYKTEMAKQSLEWFSGIVRNLNETVDTANEVYIPFKNGMLVIDKQGHPKMNEGGYIGYDVSHTCPTLYRDFEFNNEKSEFETFLERACGSEEQNEFWEGRKKSIMTLIGYMISKRKESVNFINLLTEETNAEDSGRTGKGIIATAVKYWRKRCLVDMKQVFGDDTKRWILTSLDVDTDDFIQFDDVRKNIDWEQFYIMCTDDWVIEKKGKDKIIVPKEKTPKMIFTSNFYPKANGGSQEARMRIFEISNHYSSKHTPEDEFGHRLFDDWDDTEWNRFDTFMARCVAYYLRDGYIACPVGNMQDKEYEVTVKNPDFRRWFDDRDDGLFSDLSKTHKGGEFDIEFKMWFKTKYGSNYNGYMPDDATIAKWFKLYCNSHGLTATKKKKVLSSGNYWQWTFSETSKTPQSLPQVADSTVSKKTGKNNEVASYSTKKQQDTNSSTALPSNSPTTAYENNKKNNKYNNNTHIYKGVPNQDGSAVEESQNVDYQYNSTTTSFSDAKNEDGRDGREGVLEDLGAFAPDLDEYGCDGTGHIPQTRGWYDEKAKNVYFVDSVPKPKEFPPYDEHSIPTYHWTFDPIALDIRMVICGNVSGYVVENGKTRKVTAEEIQRSKEL